MKGLKNRELQTKSCRRLAEQRQLKPGNGAGSRTFLQRQTTAMDVKHPYERWKRRNKETLTTTAIKSSYKLNTKITADSKCGTQNATNTFKSSPCPCHKSSTNTNENCSGSACFNNFQHHLTRNTSESPTTDINNTKNTNASFICNNNSNNYYSTTKNLSPQTSNSLCLHKTTETTTDSTTSTSVSLSAKSALSLATSDDSKKKKINKNNNNNNDNIVISNIKDNDSTSNLYTSRTSFSSPSSCHNAHNDKQHKTKTQRTGRRARADQICVLLIFSLVFIYLCPTSKAIRLANSVTKGSSPKKEQLYIGLIAPHTNFGKRDYLRAIHNAVAGFNKTRGAKLTYFKDYQFQQSNIRFDMMSLTPSPTGKCFHSQRLRKFVSHF